MAIERTLSIIKDAIELIEERHGLKIDPDEIPLDDEDEDEGDILVEESDPSLPQLDMSVMSAAAQRSGFLGSFRATIHMIIDSQPSVTCVPQHNATINKTIK